jgi:hypothetical protein
MDPVVLRSLEDVRQYSQTLAVRRVADDPVVRALESARRMTWLTMLAGAFLFYYLQVKLHEAVRMLT